MTKKNTFKFLGEETPFSDASRTTSVCGLAPKGCIYTIWEGGDIKMKIMIPSILEKICIKGRTTESLKTQEARSNDMSHLSPRPKLNAETPPPGGYVWMFQESKGPILCRGELDD